MVRFLFPAFGGLLYGYDIGATSSATISIQVLLVRVFVFRTLTMSGHELGFRVVYELFIIMPFVCLSFVTMLIFA